MSILPKTETAETPAAEGGADPKGDAGSASTAGQGQASSSASAAPAPGAATPGTAHGGSGTAPSGQATTPSSSTPGTGSSTSDPKADFERKLASLADLEMTVTQRQKAIEGLEAKYKGYEGLGAALPDGVTAETLAEALGKLKAGDTVSFVRAMLRDTWNAEWLIKAADAFDAEELSPEERTRREWERIQKVEADKREAKRKADEDAEIARRKKADDDSITDASKQLDDQTKGASKWLAANVSRYPLIASMDDDEDVDHVQMFRARLIDWVEKHDDKIPTDEEGLAAMRRDIFDAIEAKHRRQRDRLSPPPRNLREEMSEFDRIELARLKEQDRNEAPVVLSRQGPPGGRTGADEAMERLAAWDREQAEKARLSYGR